MKNPGWRIVADENIPFIRELFGIFGEVVLCKGREISARDVRDADVLLVRSVTRVNAALLEHSRVKFVGTCTIGIDHLDVTWLEQQHIAWSAAPGCNAMAVVQYVLACLALNELLEKSNSIAIVGCGNVGGRLYQTLKALGNKCVAVDPFKTREELPDLAVFEAIYDCDVVCLHTPLTLSGPYPTWHLFDEKVLARLRANCLLINAGRGAVIDNQALLRVLHGGKPLRVVLDVWEPEPDINRDLLASVVLGTPHIAGYSYEGKVNGSTMIFDALCEYAAVGDQAEFQSCRREVLEKAFGEAEILTADSLSAALLASYDPRRDDKQLRARAPELPEVFDHLRKHYPKRREPSHFYLESTAVNPQLAAASGFLRQ